MKYVLLSVVCLSVAVIAKPTSTKQKRDILPGDSRYGTDYHHHHHHAHQSHENEVEVSRAFGGYAGSYTVQKNTGAYQNTVEFQPLQTVYGPPHHTPGTPIHYPARQVPYAPQPVHHHHQHHQQPSEHVETISNGYLSPVVEVTQAPVVHYTSPAVHYTTPAPSYTTGAPRYRPEVKVNNDYLPPYHGTQQKTVQGPVTSYGTPISEYQVPEVQPAVEHHDSHVIADVKSTVLEEASSHTDASVQHEEGIVQESQIQNEEEIVQEVPAQQQVKTYDPPVQQEVQTYHQETPVQQQVQTYHQETPVQQEVRTYYQETPVQQTYQQQAPVETHAHADSHAQIQPAVHTVKTVQEKVSHVHQAVQPAVYHAVQPAVHRQVVEQKFQQPAVQHQIVYQAAQVPQAYSNNYFDSGFDNFATVDSAFQSTYGTPKFQVSSEVVPQIYSTNFGNVGFGYQQESNVFSQENPQQNTQNHGAAYSFIRAPKFHVTRYVQQQIPQQSREQTPSYFRSQVVPQVPAYQQTQVVQEPAVSKSTQPIGANGGYVY